MSKPTIPEILADFIAYHHVHPAWGSLHIVLDDGNVEDNSVQFCLERARERGDSEGERLAGILLRMSKSQRGRLDRKVHEHEWRNRHA